MLKWRLGSTINKDTNYGSFYIVITLMVWIHLDPRFRNVEGHVRLVRNGARNYFSLSFSYKRVNHSNQEFFQGLILE